MFPIDVDRDEARDLLENSTLELEEDELEEFLDLLTDEAAGERGIIMVDGDELSALQGNSGGSIDTADDVVRELEETPEAVQAARERIDETRREAEEARAEDDIDAVLDSFDLPEDTDDSDGEEEE